MSTIIIARDIIISRSSDDVFAYVSNLTLDPTWRSEVIRMDTDGPMIIGMIMIEKSIFFKLSKVVTPGRITVFEPAKAFEFESSEGVAHPLKGRREVVQITSNETLFKYRLQFEYGGHAIKANLVEWVYTSWVKGYLKRLKLILEV